MAQVDVKQSFSVTLSGEEFRLVTHALAGMLRDESDRQAALNLNQALCFLRAKTINQAYQVALKAHESAVRLLPEEIAALTKPGGETS